MTPGYKLKLRRKCKLASLLAAFLLNDNVCRRQFDDIILGRRLSLFLDWLCAVSAHENVRLILTKIQTRATLLVTDLFDLEKPTSVTKVRVAQAVDAVKDDRRIITCNIVSDGFAHPAQCKDVVLTEYFLHDIWWINGELNTQGKGDRYESSGLGVPYRSPYLFLSRLYRCNCYSHEYPLVMCHLLYHH